MKTTVRLSILILCALLCLSGCTMREQTTASTAPAEAPTAPPAESEAHSETPAGPLYDQAIYDDAASAILDQYLELRENGIENFDEDAHPQLPWYSAVVASWAWNGLYYGTYDFDGNGVPELIVAAGTDEYCQPVGIYAFDGGQMRYLCPNQALGERASVTFTDGMFFVRGSGSAYSGAVTVYRIGPDGYSTEIIEVMGYEYKDAETVEYTPELGNMTAEELLSHDYLKGFDLPVEFNCFAESHDGGSGAEIPNPWSQAETPAEAAQGAVLENFILPEVIDCAEFLPEQRSLSYMDALAQAVYDNGTDRLVIRKGAGSADVSGDYNEYPETFTADLNGVEILCFGQNGEVRLARWEWRGCSFSLAFNTDDYTRPGLTEAQVKALVGQIG